MKNIRSTAIAICALLGVSSSAFGYMWTFSNHTDYKIEMELCLMATPNCDPFVIMPQSEAKMGWLPPSWWAGYCLDTMFYRATGPDGKRGLRREVNIHWLTNEGLDKVLGAVSQLGSSVQSIGVAAGQMYAASQGMPAGSIPTTPEQEAQQAKATRAGEYASAASSADLGGLISSIGKLVSTSGCKGRHFDIFEGENGTLYFTTLER